MNALHPLWFMITAFAGGCFLIGCATQPGATNSRHVGPAIGKAAGTGVGVAAGNVAGAVVGTGEGLAVGVAAPFNTTRRTVRRWRTETTADGRKIQVAEDIEVDAQGRPLKSVSPK